MYSVRCTVYIVPITPPVVVPVVVLVVVPVYCSIPWYTSRKHIDITKCKRTWSEHQYQMAEMVKPMKTPGHGRSESSAELLVT